MAVAKKAKKGAAAPKAKSLSGKTRSEQEAVHRILQKEFRGWSVTDLNTKGGTEMKTPLDVIKSTIRDSRSNRSRIQPEFWAGVRLRFRQTREDAACRNLVVADRAMPIAAQLQDGWTAMNTGNTQKKTLELLEQWFKSVGSLNQREQVITLEITLDPLLPSKTGGFSCILAALNCFRRLDSINVHATEMLAARADIDRLLARYYWRVATSVDLSTFWTIVFVFKHLF